MEDTEHPEDSANNGQVSENKVLDAGVESQGEDLIPAAASGVPIIFTREETYMLVGWAKAHTRAAACRRTGLGSRDQEVNFTGNGMAGGNGIENMTGEEKPTEIVVEENNGNPVTNV
ncbi:Uncharacterized protein Adt_41216 [Abeliophyllum distichum]|uniref:Uncharacterized protein n=1 Tax=Abeliophyllum distichum TaxID=126358 RepID=A0ABD1PN72_9LAMI